MVMLLTAAILCAIFSIAAQNSEHAFNLALRGRATQSSTYSYESTAINAIDGNTDSDFHHSSCSCTKLASPPWWRVDLLRAYKINEIIITNRGDCCPERLDGASVLVGNSLENNGNSNPRFYPFFQTSYAYYGRVDACHDLPCSTWLECGVVSSANNAGTIRFQCNGMIGRYVNVAITERGEYLQLCEVQVFGDPVYNDCYI